MLECGAARNPERRKEFAGVQVDGFPQFATLDRIEKLIAVNVDGSGEGQFLVPRKRILAKEPAEMKQCLPQGIPGSLRFEACPQEIGQEFARCAPTRCQGQEDQQRERLSGTKQELRLARHAKAGGAERLQRQTRRVSQRPLRRLSQTR